MADGNGGGPSRAAVILEALRREVLAHRAEIDAAPDLAVITVTVRLQAGTSWLRGTAFTAERVTRTRDGR